MENNKKLITCLLCNQTRFINGFTAKYNIMYKTGFANCRRCASKLTPDKIMGSSYRFYIDQVLLSGSIIYWSGPRSGYGNKRVNVQCGVCKRIRFFSFSRAKENSPTAGCCRTCAPTIIDYPKGINHRNWRGGTFENDNGYIEVIKTSLSKDEQILFYPMYRKRSYILMHRLIMARHLNRPLNKKEVVHHLNGDRADNRLANLQLVTNTTHPSENSTMWNILKDEIKRLQIKLTDNGLSID
jgi:hypothetical protein